jgi:D-xylose transport system ATP-binding protein
MPGGGHPVSDMGAVAERPPAEAAATGGEGRSPLLELRGISKAFGAIQALAGVDFEVFPAEVVALVGDNGAGKSTLIKIIAGAYRADEGQYIFDGRPVTVHGPRDVSDLGIATVYQDLALCDNLDVVGNLYLGRERRIGRGPLGIVDEVPMEQRAIEVLRDLSVKIPSVRTQVATLSGGQRQSVAVARAVMGDARVVQLDEPTAALGVAQTRQVLDLIMRLREQGLGVVVISHNLADVFEVADRIIVLRLGRRVASFTAQTVSREEVVAAITGVGSGERTATDEPTAGTGAPS